MSLPAASWADQPTWLQNTWQLRAPFHRNNMENSPTPIEGLLCNCLWFVYDCCASVLQHCKDPSDIEESRAAVVDYLKKTAARAGEDISDDFLATYFTSDNLDDEIKKQRCLKQKKENESGGSLHDVQVVSSLLPITHLLPFLSVQVSGIGRYYC